MIYTNRAQDKVSFGGSFFLFFNKNVLRSLSTVYPAELILMTDHNICSFFEKHTHTHTHLYTHAERAVCQSSGKNKPVTSSDYHILCWSHQIIRKQWLTMKVEVHFWIVLLAYQFNYLMLK